MQAISAAEAACAIEASSGSQFDPAVVDAFGSRFEDFRQAQGRCANGVSINEDELVGVGNPELVLAATSTMSSISSRCRMPLI